MKNEKHIFAMNCGCQRCKEIVDENKNERVRELIKKLEEKHPILLDKSKDVEDWSVETKRDCIQFARDARHIYFPEDVIN